MENENPGIMKFYAQWCAPCKMMNPIWEKLNLTFKDKINFAEIDVDDEKFKSIVESFGVTSVPSFVFVDKEGNWTKYDGTYPYAKMTDLIDTHFNLK